MNGLGDDDVHNGAAVDDDDGAGGNVGILNVEHGHGDSVDNGKVEDDVWGSWRRSCLPC